MEATTPAKKLMRSATVKRRLGDISGQTLWRYCRDPNLGFPKCIRINGVRFWESSEIEEFIDGRRRS
jgi:predicted DNA-binding transcriptional regulator AlpA